MGSGQQAGSDQEQSDENRSLRAAEGWRVVQRPCGWQIDRLGSYSSD